MKILLLGLMFKEEEYDNLKKKNLIKLDLPIAANVFQKNLIKGLLQNNVESLYGVNSLPVGTWPLQYKNFYLDSKISNIHGIECFNTRTINVVGLKQVSRAISTYNFLKSYIKKNPGVVILTYNFYLPYYVALERLRKKGYSFSLCTLVTDLPNEYGIVTEKGIRKVLARKIGRKTMNMTKMADSFVLLTEKMCKPLQVGNRPYTIVEGFASENIVVDSVECKNKRNIVYTGTMNKKFGVENLIKAFLKIEYEDVELHLYGSGDMSEEVKELSKKNERIKYFGSVSRNTILKIQKEATLLVNPRDGEDTYTKYSFPSKTMEYLVSGRPVLAYLLEGIPQVYENYIVKIDDNKEEGLLDAMNKVLNMNEEERVLIGKRAREFVLNNKNCYAQTSKIISMFEQLLKI